MVMNMRDSMARLENSLTVPKYLWWHGEQFLAVAKRVEELGATEVTVRMYPGLRTDGLPEVWLQVVGNTDEMEKKMLTDGGVNEFNVSFPCPPICPG